MTIPPELTDKSRGVRIQKAMAEAGVASRRDCEQIVEQGRVRVNGQVVNELPAWVDPARDQIEVDGQKLARPRKTARRTSRHHYIALHKPRHVISTTDDERNRRTVLDLIDVPGRPRLFPVGRLDADSTGLILLTDDGELANRLMHPRYEVPKQYVVSVRGKLTNEDVDKLRSGLYLADHGGGRSARPQAAKKAAVESVKILGFERDRARGDRTRLAITLKEGQNREIRRLLARLGYKVRRLKRTAIGPVTLKGLAVGAWRPLRAQEVQGLYKEARG